MDCPLLASRRDVESKTTTRAKKGGTERQTCWISSNAIFVWGFLSRHPRVRGWSDNTTTHLTTNNTAPVNEYTMSNNSSLPLLVRLIIMDFPYATEIVCLAMSIQGSMSVRSNSNNNNSASSSNTNNNKRPPPPTNTFHAFIKSTLTAYAGATFTNVFMARPTAMLSNDIFFGSCILGFAMVNYVPYGYSLCNTFPILAIINILSQVFRISGIINYSDVAYHAFKDAPSAYYPMPIFGPIIFPTLLGNMGGFIWYGIDGYLAQGGGGIPWLFQQGMACSSFYHFYAHDMHGSVGTTLRSIIHPTAVHIVSHVLANDDDDDNNDEQNTTTTTTADSIIDIIDDNVLFAKLIIGTFMILMSILLYHNYSDQSLVHLLRCIMY